MLAIKQRGWTLLELIVVIGLTAFVAAIGYPAFRDAYADARFKAFGDQLAGHLTMARSVAQSLETIVRLDLAGSSSHAYQLELRDGSSWMLLSEAPSYPPGVGLKLPEEDLPHPTRAGVLNEALSSTHAPRVHFSAHGASSATLVFSDGGKQVFCVVVSAGSGRCRLFRWQGDQWHRQL